MLWLSAARPAIGDAPSKNGYIAQPSAVFNGLQVVFCDCHSTIRRLALLLVWPARTGLGRCGLDQLGNPRHVAEGVGNASGHRRSDAQTLVDAAEVVR
jgi:hypothetical protein